MDDACDIVEIARTVLEPDHVRDLRNRDRGGLGVPGVVAVVDDDGQIGRGGDIADVGDEAGLGHLDEIRRQKEQPVGAGVLCGLREQLGLGDGAARACVDGHPARDHLDGGADDRAELLGLEGMEFACAAGDEDAAGTRVDTAGDVPGQCLEVDFSGIGERGNREEQNSTERGVHLGDSLVSGWGQSCWSRPSMRRHRLSGLPSAIALGSNEFGTFW